MRAFSHFICLYGSEHGGRVEYVTSEFLSCLYGSERSLQPLAKTVGFLSCLYGSELKYYTFSPLLIKQNHLIFLLSPFLSLPFPAALIINNLPSPPKIGFSPFHPINKKSVTSFEITDFTNLLNNQINALLPPCAFVHSGIRKSAHFLFIQRDGDLTAVHQRTKQQFVGKRFFRLSWMTRAIGRAPIARS